MATKKYPPASVLYPWAKWAANKATGGEWVTLKSGKDFKTEVRVFRIAALGWARRHKLGCVTKMVDETALQVRFFEHDTYARESDSTKSSTKRSKTGTRPSGKLSKRGSKRASSKRATKRKPGTKRTRTKSKGTKPANKRSTKQRSKSSGN